MQKSAKRSILVTGSNKGLGLAIIEKLLAGNIPYDLILTSRNVKAGEEALNTLQKKYTNSASTLTYHQLDINNDKSINTFIDWLKGKKGRLDVLVNNAGIFYPTSNDAEKELTINTDFTNTVKLTEKLLPLLTDDAKIVNISSFAGKLSWQGPTLVKSLEDPKLTEQKLLEIATNFSKFLLDAPPNPYYSDTSYPAAKALLNAYTRILVNKLKKNQQVYAIHPGLVDTDIISDWVKTFPPEVLEKNKPKTPEEGADTPVYLINLPFENNPELNGKFIIDRKVEPY